MKLLVIQNDLRMRKTGTTHFMKNTIQHQLIGDFLEKFHFSLVVARLAGNTESISVIAQ
jgi:hypothetical protein